MYGPSIYGILTYASVLDFDDKFLGEYTSPMDGNYGVFGVYMTHISYIQ